MGTAAYEGVPALFCNCRVCRLSKELGGRNIRSRSQALINDELLIDFNADTVWHYHKYGFDWDKICGCLITHSHCDHLYPADVEMSAPWFSHGGRQISFYAARDGYEKLKRVADNTGGGAKVTLIEEDKTFTVGKYAVLPLKANHDSGASPVIFSISADGKRMLYAHDTGVFTNEVWNGLKREGYYNFISLDCTGCLGLNGEWRDGHMSLKTNLETLDKLKEEKLIDDKTKIVLNHFSHNGGQVYDEMLKETEKLGLTVSYDGLEIEF